MTGASPLSFRHCAYGVAVTPWAFTTIIRYSGAKAVTIR